MPCPTLEIMFRMRLPRSLAALLCAVAMLTAACGGDEEGSVDTVPPAPSTSSTSTSTTIATTSTTTTEAPTLSGEPAFDAASTVSTVGIDRIIFGMTVSRAQSELGAVFVRVDESESSNCHRVRPEGGPTGVELTVSAGTIERVDLTTDLIKTRSGAGVGSTEDELATLFGDRLTTAARTGGGNTVTFTPVDESDKQFRVIFETDGTVVTSYRSGRLPVIEPLVPCGAAA